MARLRAVQGLWEEVGREPVFSWDAKVYTLE